MNIYSNHVDAWGTRAGKAYVIYAKVEEEEEEAVQLQISFDCHNE